MTTRRRTMSTKLEQIKDRKEKLAAQMAALENEEKKTESKIKERYERRIVRAFRNNGLLSHSEKIILNEINQMAVRLNGENIIPVIEEPESYVVENKDSNNGW